MADAILANRFCVYLHSRLTSGEPFYIGKGRIKRARAIDNRSRWWKSIVNKDGGFYLCFLAENVSEEFALLLEIEAIDIFRRRGCALANMTDGGEGASGRKCTDVMKAKLRAAKRNAEQRKAMSSRLMGRRLSEETKKKMSAAKIGKSSNRKGCVLSAETRRKCSESKRGNKYAKKY